MSRSRAGCATCKKRHRKCDETKPRCLQCQAQNLECEGYDLVLRWDTGIASRGRFTGASAPIDQGTDGSSFESRGKRREGVEVSQPVDNDSLDAVAESASSSVSRGNHSQIGLSYSLGDVVHPDPLASLNLTQPPPGSYITGHAQPPSRSLQPWPGRTEDERSLFKQFSESTIFFLYSTHIYDWFKPYICHLAHESEALFSILVATHLYTVSPKNPEPGFEEYYNRSLRLFREQLDSYDGTLNVGIMCAGLFICTLNLFQGTPWSVHLELMTKVYGLTTDLPHSGYLAEELQFPFELMGIMDLPTFVRGRKTVTLGIWSRYRASKDAAPNGRIAGVEIVTGLPRSLLDIFAEIRTDEADDLFLTWPGDVGDVPHCHLWEAYRLAGILMGRRLRRCLAGGGESDVANRLPVAPSTETLMARLMAALDALCETRQRPQYAHQLATNSIAYPYTAARLEVAVLRRRPEWVDELRRFVKLCDPYAMTPNVRALDEMLDEALEMGDDSYDIDEQARRRNTEIALF